ncbi:hypothetical protein H6A64_06735 [Lacrimispora saccharolytica]|nr:hypothetical protein [Lacrimispora saccharolytica]
MLRVNFKSYGNYIVDSLYQWDKNQVLEIEGLALEVVPEIHFSNMNMIRSIVKQATIEDGIIKVDIPNSLLQQPLFITAYIGIYDNEKFNTIETVIIPVIPRTKPEDYVLENDTEVYSFVKLENELVNKVNYDEFNRIINIERERINNLTKLDPGSTTGDAELTDIRIGYNGKMYGNAGEAVRTQIGSLHDEIDILNQGGLIIEEEFIGQQVNNWLDEHPEATTTVQDDSIEEIKFTEELRKKTLKDYVTPQMFGAIGDGIADDTTAIQNAIKFCEENHRILYFPNGVYIVSDTLILSRSIVLTGATYHYDVLSSDNVYTGLSILKCVSDNKKTFIVSEDTAYDVSISFLIFSSDSYAVEATGDIATKGNPKKYYRYNSSGYEVNCLNLEKSIRANINNCTFNGFSGSGIITGQHRHITDCSFTHCNIGINVSNYDNLIHHCWFRFCSLGIYTEKNNTIFLSDSWFDQIEQIAIKNIGGGFMLISNCEFDLIEYCAIYSKYLWNSFIQARQSRCGLYYGGFEPNEVPEGEEYKACCIYSESVSRDNNFQINVQRREIKEGYGIAPSFFFHGNGLNTSNVILDVDLDHVAKSWLFENTNLLISGKQYKSRYTLKYNNTGCTTKDNDDPNGAYYSIDIGDMYISTGGKIYIAVKANSNSDWVLIGEK